jgi:hypothetical protein
MSPYEESKFLNKSELSVRYLISVWDEVQGNWRERPDHVQQMFLRAEEETKELLKQKV